MTATARPGFHFKEGKLFVFTARETVMIESWPELTAVKTGLRTKNWRRFVPVFRLLRPARSGAGAVPSLGPGNLPLPALDPELERVTAFRAFRFTIPPEVVAATERFPSRQWSVLKMCQRSRQARELTVANPALGFCLANLNSFRPTFSDPVDLAGMLAGLKQRELLARMGFPGTENCARILAKILPEAIQIHAALPFRQALQNDAVGRLLSHLPVINAGVLALVAEAGAGNCITPVLLAEVSQSPAEMETPQVVHLLREIRNLHGQMGRAVPLRGFQSVEQVRRKQQELVEEHVRFLQQREEERMARLLQEEHLPEPPVPGTPDIVPIVRTSELRAEGRAQHHCVGSYASSVRRGERYVYRVLSPERATLSIVKGADGCWQIEQLYLSCNQSVSPTTRAAVQDWLGKYSLGA